MDGRVSKIRGRPSGTQHVVEEIQQDNNVLDDHISNFEAPMGEEQPQVNPERAPRQYKPNTWAVCFPLTTTHIFL